MTTDPDAQVRRLCRAFLVVALGALLAAAWYAPLDRNQEARILETGREMALGRAETWIFPRLNGYLRLRKPPLTYWMTACSYKLFGVSTFTGRLPFVATTWLTIALVARAGRRRISPTAGLVAAGLLLSSSLYQTYGHLAEADALTALLVTGACLAFWDLVEARLPVVAMGSSLAAGFCLGLAVISKGPPAIFPAAFFIALLLIEKNARPLWLFVKHGGLVLLIFVAVPWWLIVSRDPAFWNDLAQEAKMLGGENHGRPFYFSFIFTAKAMLPWIGPAILGLIWAILQGVERNRTLLRLIIWFGIIFVGLTVTPQKQEHYFITLVPPMMLMAAAWADAALRSDKPSDVRVATWIFGGTAAIAALAGLAILALPRSKGLKVEPRDIALSASLFVAFASVVYFTFHSPRWGIFVAILVAPAAMTVTVNIWANRLRPPSFAEVAAKIRADHPNSRFAFYPIENFRLNFELQRVMPRAATEAELNAILIENPRLLILVENDDDTPPAAMPPSLRRLEFHRMRDKTIEVWARPATGN